MRILLTHDDGSVTNRLEITERRVYHAGRTWHIRRNIVRASELKTDWRHVFIYPGLPGAEHYPSVTYTGSGRFWWRGEPL